MSTVHVTKKQFDKWYLKSLNKQHSSYMKFIDDYKNNTHYKNNSHYKSLSDDANTLLIRRIHNQEKNFRSLTNYLYKNKKSDIYDISFDEYSSESETFDNEDEIYEDECNIL
jgi:hypothetical protein